MAATFQERLGFSAVAFERNDKIGTEGPVMAHQPETTTYDVFGYGVHCVHGNALEATEAGVPAAPSAGSALTVEELSALDLSSLAPQRLSVAQREV